MLFANYSYQFVLFLLLIATNWWLFIFLAGCFLEKKIASGCLPEKKFAIIVPAHNEAPVITKIIESIKKSDYPSNLFDIYVIADNCTDKTAEVAERHGAIVHIRSDNNCQGKGFALIWMFEKLFKLQKPYNAIVILDADNLISKNYLARMNDMLCNNHKVIQGRVIPIAVDSITSIWHAIFLEHNYRYNSCKYNVGLSSNLLGTGMCIDVEILKVAPWQATSLTEDLEYTIELCLVNQQISFHKDAVTYDECATNFTHFWLQRKRWCAGTIFAFYKYAGRLIKKFSKTRSLWLLETAVQCAWPITTVALCFISFMKPVFEYYLLVNHFETLFFSIFLFSIYTAPVLFLLTNKVKVYSYWYLFLAILIYPLYAITWVLVVIHAICTIKQKKWYHSSHANNISIEQLEN